MRYGEALGQNGAAVRTERELRPAASAAPVVREIPYDYAVKFSLKGVAANREQGVINISTEGAFVAVAIGYSFIPVLPPHQEAPSTPGTEVGRLFEALQTDGLMDRRKLLQCLLARLCGIDFKYSIIDSGSGRELQNQAIHNIAGLGEPSGERPFRPLAKPMVFQPRSTIRIEVEEVSTGGIYGYQDPNTGQRVGAELFIVLHGYKVLGWGTALP